VLVTEPFGGRQSICSKSTASLPQYASITGLFSLTPLLIAFASMGENRSSSHTAIFFWFNPLPFLSDTPVYRS
jgi:hypothetical protein